MRQIFNFIAIFAVSAFIAVGCADDNASFKHPNNEVGGGNSFDPNSNGYISFENFAVEVETLTEEFDDDKAGEVMAVKSGDNADAANPYADYTVQITRDSDSEVVYSDTYANTLLVTDLKKYNAGTYTIKVFSCKPSEIPAAAWYAPEYKGEKSLTIGDEKVTSIGDITCTLANVMVSVSISADVVALFDPAPEKDIDKLQVILESGKSSLTFYPTDEGKEGYFAVPADETISIYLTGLYNQSSDPANPDYIKFNKGDWTQVIKGVKAGQFRDISISIGHNGTGSTLIEVNNIKEWSYDDEIVVNATSSSFLLSTLTEEIVADPFAPTLTLGNGLDINKPYFINSEMFDTDLESYNVPYKAIIAPKGGAQIRSISMAATSTNESIAAELEELGFDANGSIKLYENGAFVAPTLDKYLLFKSDAYSDALTVAIKYEGIVALNKYVGEHTVVVTYTDTRGLTSTSTLYFESAYVEANLPTVEWVGNYDFETRYEIFAKGEGDENNPAVELQMTSLSEKGFESLTVTIISEALSDDLLSDVGLSSELDLANAEGDVAASLAGLDLPVGDQIVGQKSVTVNITSLISLLAGVGDGESDFIMEVGDENGVVSRTVMVIKK